MHLRALLVYTLVMQLEKAPLMTKNVHEEMQILDSRLYNRKSLRFFEKSTMKEQHKQVSDP